MAVDCVTRGRLPPLFSAALLLPALFLFAALPSATYAQSTACPALNGTVYTLNLTAILSPSVDPHDYYETVQLVAAVQAFANRERPNLFVHLEPADSGWFPYVQHEWLSQCKLAPLDGVDSLIELYGQQITQAIVYDVNVPATSLVAATMCGVLDALPFANRSDPAAPTLFDRYVAGASPRFKVRHSLVNQFDGSRTGSAKNDAYRWAADNLITNATFGARADPTVMAYMIDYFWTGVSTKAPIVGNTVPNQDWPMMRRAFFWDLDVWSDEAPNDDPNQPLGTDHATLIYILEAANNVTGSATSPNQKLIHLVGFVPWAFKYVGAKHAGVATEWEMVLLISSYNVYVDADACCIQAMSNAAFYSQLPLARRYVQPAPSSPALLEQRGYINATTQTVKPRLYASFYVGDYDSAAWLYTQIKQRWDDPTRGQVPMGWAVDPELAWRFPVAFHYMLSNMTSNDRLIVGDSGAGYVNPTQLLAPRAPSGYNSAAHAWQQHNGALYQRFDQRFTGFLLQGDAGAMTPQAEDMYQPFSGRGVVDELGPLGASGTHMRPNNLPVFVQQDLPSGDAAAAAKTMAARYNASDANPQFFMWRSVLQMPQYYADIVAELKQMGLYPDKITIVDPLDLAALGRAAMSGGSNAQLVTYEADNAPESPSLACGQKFSLTVTMRNDGWDVIPKNATLCAAWQSGSAGDGRPVREEVCATLAAAIAVASNASVTVSAAAPSTGGPAVLEFGLKSADGLDYSSWGNAKISYQYDVNC